MIKNYFKSAWRNLLKNKFYSAINIAGLATGLAIGIMILLWVQDELSYDDFHHNGKRIYRVIAHLGTGSSQTVWQDSPAAVAIFGKKEIPEVENAVRIRNNFNYSIIKYKDKLFTESKSAYVDPTLFKIFDFKLLKGDINHPFADNNSVILTATLAKKYFGKENPIGKIITLDNKQNFQVNAIVADFPENSSIKYDLLFPLSIIARQYETDTPRYWKTMDGDWGNYMYNTYFLIQPGTSAQTIEKKLTGIHRQNQSEAKDNFYTLQPMDKVHLYAADGSASAKQTVTIFLLVAILILLIACINYVNLSTARSMIRSKEVSVRKIVGAGKIQLFGQFIIDSSLLFIFASILAFGIIYLCMPVYNNLSGKQLVFSLADPKVWGVILLTIVGTLMAASIYPASLLASFKPIQTLKGKLAFGTGNSSFRKLLVVTQFIFSVSLIIATIIISRQLQYIRAKELGYDKAYVFSFGMRQIQPHFAAVRTELLKQPGITAVTSADHSIIQITNTTGDTYWDGKEPDRSFLIHPMGIDKDFVPFFKMKMVAGANFSGSKTDSAHFILNEAAVLQAGIKDPVGKNFTLWQTKGTIIGVLSNFHFASLKQKIEPAIFYYNPESRRIYIRTTGNDAPKAIAAAKNIWKKYNADFPFDYSFLDQTYDAMYKTDQRTGFLFNLFAIVAIAISCLGLFGLATYTAQVRTKEIGIRKVLGATTVNVTRLLAKDFINLVIIAILIASPIAWWAMNKWLQDFVYRINVEWWVFALAGCAALLIALMTISFQAIKAALANPVRSLRSE